MRKTLLAVTLAAALAAGQPSVLDQVWSLLTAAWSDAGCIMDPDGRCAPAPRTDEGCGMDPSGRCLPTPRADVGCGMDPNGCPG
ncbi:MAG TPA: hypothetical protein VF179_03015 [Thermoanaerobaculia bacterium]|nr:hypothetical protein [Thermoanaerobaculia bacterium]